MEAEWCLVRRVECDWIGECASRLYRGTGRRDLAPLPKIALLTYLTFVSVCVCEGVFRSVQETQEWWVMGVQWCSCSPCLCFRNNEVILVPLQTHFLTAAFLGPSQCEESVSLHVQFVYKHQKRSYMELRAMWGFCGSSFHADSVCLISISITCSDMTHRFSPKSNYLRFIIKLFDPWFLSFQMLLSVKAKRV